ncbi:MAG: 50S ribosomal protein L25 [Bacteroidales bacterium]|nr:50S ribosomal protein L25 [Bacteroidales bacterium]
MRIVSMSGSLRENVGKKDAKALRRQDLVPCVMYGKGEQIMFALKQTDFQRILFNPEPCFVEIDLNGTKHSAMVKEMQFHPVSDIVYHCDFFELTDDKPIVMSIPVHTTGTAAGVMKGGKLVFKQKRLNVKAIPANMPSEVLIDVTPLDIAQRVKVQDIHDEKYEILNVKTSDVVVINSTRAAATATTETTEEA